MKKRSKKLNNLCLGTANFGQKYGYNKNLQITYSEIERILIFVRKNCINMIDTANSYGETEKILGNFGVNDLKIITKIPALPDNKVSIDDDWFLKKLDKSLKNLKVQKLYGLLFHRVEDLKNSRGKEIYNDAINLKSEKIVNKIGVSIYNPNDLEWILKEFDFDIIQVPLNIFDGRIVTSGWVDRLYKNNIEIHARSIFLQGKLLMNQKDLPSYFQTWKKQWQKWDNWLLKENVSALSTCLNYILSHKKISKIILGVDNLNQLVEISEYIYNYEKPNYPSISLNNEMLINPVNWGKN